MTQNWWTRGFSHEGHRSASGLPPALAWLTTTAICDAWQLTSNQRRATPHTIDAIDELIIDRGQTAPAGEALTVQHLRLELIAQSPERPRRYLLRLALGYSYAEVAAADRPANDDQQAASGYRARPRPVTNRRRTVLLGETGGS